MRRLLWSFLTIAASLAVLASFTSPMSFGAVKARRAPVSTPWLDCRLLLTKTHSANWTSILPPALHDRFEVREATLEDGPKIFKLMREIFDEYDIEPLSQWYDSHPDDVRAGMEQVTRAPGRIFLVVIDAKTGALVGSAGVMKKPDALPEDVRTGEIAKLYLRPELRGLGIGKALFETLLKISALPEFGYEKLFLLTRTEWKEALSLYASYGFKRVAPLRYPDSPGSYEFELDLSTYSATRVMQAR